jgi:hypothetical protein
VPGLGLSHDTVQDIVVDILRYSKNVHVPSLEGLSGNCFTRDEEVRHATVTLDTTRTGCCASGMDRPRCDSAAAVKGYCVENDTFILVCQFPLSKCCPVRHPSRPGG